MRNKYGVRIDGAGRERRTIDNIIFDSLREAQRYVELKMLQRARKISGLELQPIYPIVVNGIPICDYEADFRYRDLVGAVVVEDVKGVRTREYRLKAALMKACYGITILET